MFNKFSLVLISSCLIFSYYSQSKKILFLGNSYTYYNSLPQLISDVALSFGDSINWDSNTPGGYTFQGHSTNSVSLSKISMGIWDHVILQEQSQLPSFPPSQVATDCFPYASILIDSIRAGNICTEPVFFMTWGRENGDQSNCANYPPVCTYDGMQGRLRESYLQMSVDNQCTVSPVGAVWKYVRDNHPSIGLYSSDGSHPSIYGSYLAACVHYSTIFRKSAVGSTFMSTLGHSDAVSLQQAAALVVLDSLENWSIGANDVIADFTYQSNGTLVDFNFTGQQEDSVFWDFGNGLSSNNINPTHDFQNSGAFIVTLIASNSCEADTTSQTLTLSSLNITDYSLQVSMIQSDNIIILNFDNFNQRTISLTDIQGKLLYHNNSNAQYIELNIPRNIICFISIHEGEKSKVFKLICQ